MLTLVHSEDLATRWREWEAAPKSHGCAWGIPWVERAIGHAPMPGSVVLVGADSNVGKTFFALELLRNFAASGPVVLFSLEDPPLEMGRRMQDAGYTHPNLHVAFPDPDDVLPALDELATGRPKPVAVAIDYAQCVSGEMETLNTFIKGVRNRALAAQIPVVVTSQINTPPPGIEDAGIPSPNRLKGTRALKERADIIFMMANGKERTLRVQIAKCKGAPVGAKARYRRAEGGRLVQVTASMDVEDNENEE